jgi:predicted permease
LTNLLELYFKLAGLVCLGFFIGRKLPTSVATRVGQILFWAGIPVSIVNFLPKADFSGQIWMAAAIAQLAVFLGAFLAWVGIKWQIWSGKIVPPPATQASLILAAMVGNTGYLGYPITLTLVGTHYFAWALLYDLLGSTLGAYGWGVALAAHLRSKNPDFKQVLKAIGINPALWSFAFGLWWRHLTIPTTIQFCLEICAWTAVILSLLLIGMRLSKLNSWQSLPQAGIGLAIKMLLVPLVIGSILPLFGLTGEPARVMVLQTAMPPAFATLVVAETFELDRDLAVTAVAGGTIALLFTLPLWLWLF